MFLDINNIDDDGISFDESLRLTRVHRDNPDIVEPPTMTLRGSIRPGPSRRSRAEGATLDGEIAGSLPLRCSRCLDPVEIRCRTVFCFVLVAEIPARDEQDPDDGTRKTNFFEVESGKLDLEQLAAEQVYLELPLKPLCGADCAGLCPTCGINRNRLECACRVEHVDPRLQALQEIRDRMGES